VQDPPEADPEAHHRYITLSDWEGQGERSPARRSVLEQPLQSGPLKARRTAFSAALAIFWRMRGGGSAAQNCSAWSRQK
jgi:hypothetical protein